MDLSIYHKDFTQHDLFGLFPGAPGGRALRDTYGQEYLIMREDEVLAVVTT